MHRVFKLTGCNVIGEFDTFPNYLYLISFSKDVFTELTRLVKTGYEEGKLNDTESRVYNCISRYYNPEDNEFYTLSLLIDEPLYTDLKDDIYKIYELIIESYYRDGSSKTVISKSLENLGLKKAKLEDCFNITKITNKNFSVGFPKCFIADDNLNGFTKFEVTNPEIENTLFKSINGIDQKITLIQPVSNVNYLMDNYSLGSKPSGNFRFFRKSLNPIQKLNNCYVFWGEGVNEWNEFSFSLISEDEFQENTKNLNFKRILGNSSKLEDRSNYTDDVHKLIPGHVYALPYIKHLLCDYSREPRGSNSLTQALYLGEVRLPHGHFYQEESLTNLGYSVFFENYHMTNPSRSFIFGGQPYSKVTKAYIFINLGQLAKFNKGNINFYTINENDINTFDKFVDYFLNYVMPSTFENILGYTNNSIHDCTYDFFCAGKSKPSLVSLMNSLSPMLLTLGNNTVNIIKSETQLQTSLPFFIDLGKCMDEKNIDLVEFFNKITIKSIDLFKKKGIKLNISYDSEYSLSFSDYGYQYAMLPFVYWITPDWYNKNAESKKSILNYLKYSIRIATDEVIRTIAEINEYKEWVKGNPSASKLLMNRMKLNQQEENFNKSILQQFNSETVKLSTGEEKNAVDFIEEVTRKYLSIFGKSNNNRPINKLNQDCFRISDGFSNTVCKIISRDRKSLDDFLNLFIQLNDTIDTILGRYSVLAGVEINPPNTGFFTTFKSNSADVNAIYDVLFNWFSETLYDSYKNSGFLTDTEYNWIDKFNIQKDELKGFDFSN